MKAKRVWYGAIFIIGVCVMLAAARPAMSAPQATSGAIHVDNDDLGGVVKSAKGPEAGVWVIAETKDLPTPYRKIVVTDDEGRYLLPDLPKATYDVWVRGYGLVDSPKVRTEPGKILNLTAVVAPDAHAAAQYYPGNYWYAMLKMPARSEFPGTGDKGNGISPNVKSLEQWMGLLKTTGCQTCHQMGDKATREIPASEGPFKSTYDAWEQRLSHGQDGGAMGGVNMGKKAMLTMYADWTDRINAGEIPDEVPPRPQGLERNLVITEWDWNDPHFYTHDAVSTDKNNPTVNANGPIYGDNEVSSDFLSYLDPVHSTTKLIPIPVKDPETPYASRQLLLEPWTEWGNNLIWKGKTTPHSSMLDSQARVWTTSAFRQIANPDYCKDGSSPSSKLFPMKSSGRQVSVYDPKTDKFTLISTCFGTHHLQFSHDENTLWLSTAFANSACEACVGTDLGAVSDVVGWLDIKKWNETHDEAKSQGWMPLILDTVGDGKPHAWIEPGQPADPTKDVRVRAGFYGIITNPIDGSVWGSELGFPGAVVRVSPGSNPPITSLTEVYEPPLGNPKAAVQGYTPRGIDIDTNGVIWSNMSGSGGLGSFDRRKCKGPLNGPTATGQHCPEGWTIYPFPGPNFKNADSKMANSTSTYYNWVDQFDTLGLGKNVPIATGNGNDSLMALQPDTGKYVILRVPYPMGFYAKGLDGRIDDPNGGWKGRAVWSSFGTRTDWHIEGGKGTPGKVVKFQIRPNPLAD